MRILRTVAAAHGHHEADDHSTTLQAGIRKRGSDNVRHERVRGNEHVCSRYQYARNAFSETTKELSHALKVGRAQRRKARERRPRVAVEGRGNPPDSALAFSKFALLGFRILHQAIRRVGDNRMDTVSLAAVHPVKTIILIKRCPAANQSGAGFRVRFLYLSAGGCPLLSSKPVATMSRPLEHVWTQPQVRAHGRSGNGADSGFDRFLDF